MQRRILGLVIGLVLTAYGSCVLAGPPQLVTAVEGIAEFKLDNGMRVLLFPDASKPQLTVNMTVFVGSRHEGYGEAGMAHLLEHMLFKGTEDHPEVPKILKDHGAQFNGTTWLDRTNYFETLPASPANLEFAIRLEADRMVNSFVRKEDLVSEMTVVRNEFERGENSPTRVLGQRMMATAYEWHNYGKTTIGNRADIERVPIDNLKDFYRRYYQPDNAMVIVSGQFNPQRALAYIQKYFGSIPKPTRKLNRTYTEEPPQDGERRVSLRRVGDVSLAGAVYHIPAGAHPDYVPLDVLERILTASPSGRLYKSLVKTKKAASVRGSAFATHDPSVIRFMAEVTSGNDAEEVLGDLVTEIESIGDDGVTAEEVKRAAQYWLKNWELQMADSADVAVQLSEWAAQGDWRLMFIYRDRLEKVTPADVQRVAKSYLRQNNRTVGLFLPTDTPSRVAVPATPDLEGMIGEYKGRKALAQGEAFDVAPENIESRTDRGALSSGIKVALLPKKTRGEMVQVQVTLRYGNEKALKGQAVASEVLPQLMLRGTKSLTRQEIQDQLDAHHAQLGASGGVGTATFSITTKRDSLPHVLEILRQVLREPKLPVDELGLIQNRRVSRLESQRTDPIALAQNALVRQTSPYDPDHIRYNATIDEEIQRWQSVTRADVLNVYQDLLSSANGEIVIVGDFDPTAAKAKFDEMLAGWESNVEYARVPRVADVKLDGARQAIETPGKENAVYIASDIIKMRDDHKDYAPLMIGNYILGSGGLSSRLGDRVRQKDGLSYSVGSMLRAQSKDNRTSLMIFAITNPLNMPKVEKAIREELDRFVKDGVTSEELEAAKRGFMQGQVVRRSDDSNLAGVLGSTLNNDRTMEYYADLEKQIAGLTVDVVNEVVRKYVKPDRITVVVAGDFSGKKPKGSE
jgi:zinc protease